MQKRMTGFFDIHTHILPGVDDGAQNLQEALELVRMAWEDGSRGLFLTSHYRGSYRKNTPQQLTDVFCAFQDAVAEQFPEMSLYLGSEAQYEMDLPELLDTQKVLTLAGSRYVLLEFHPAALRSRIISGIAELQRYGYTPIIAHAERYTAFAKDSKLANAVVDMGALIQLNASSLTGKHGLRIKGLCHRMLRQGLVHFIASDTHDSTHRPPQLQACWQLVSKKYTVRYATALFWENAQAIIENRELY